ncbi:patatin-like phospholipase family protein [Urbifossiella limnaea]|uniref:Patatin-like phospholipase n=1 Tax=Urbifossiella limnaea TaxID=2528023 RepID=A0A517Y0E2_9BACT|nr:patatin-like phospholipase family protein [Urbifossiella limnaea]QDU23227.1 Patatin-like phospholipase [Urbifossiella limnaea]
MDRCVRGTIGALLLAALAAAGCAIHPPRRPVPFTPPHAQPLAPADHPGGPAGEPVMAMSPVPGCLAPFDPAASDAYPMRRPRNVLALSSGAAYGAYAAGFINGWTDSGTRPEFDVVTGISTGALMAPFAFLGPEYDVHMGHLYTTLQTQDVFRIRTWVTIPFKDSVASSSPLQRLIEKEITPTLMTRIAEEHKKGRRLYVGTTNLDTRRLVVWDVGAIACRPCPEGCELFRDVLLASASVPGMMPPVRFRIDVDGERATELHADGAVSAQLFVPSHVFAAAAAGAAADPPAAGPGPHPPGGNLYAVVSGKLYPDAAPVRPRVLPVLGASVEGLIYAHCRGELANLYGLSRASGLRYHLTALDQGYQGLQTSVDFDRKGLKGLFDEGRRQGEGPAWMYGPPALSPGDGDYIRSGLRFRRPPAHVAGP